jgi:hypothetical protein
MKEPIIKDEIEGGVREEGVKEKKKFIYDKHGEREPKSVYAHFVYGCNLRGSGTQDILEIR